jgi:para-aminobenzoate synthetase component I
MANNFASKVNAFSLSGQPFFFMVGFDKKNSQVFARDKLPGNILFSVPGYDSQMGSSKQIPAFQFSATPPDFTVYRQVFEKVCAEINFGNSYLLNLTFKSRIHTNLTLRNIFEISKAKYRLLYKDQFVVFSPETFVQIKDGLISSCPMKGTIDAGLRGAESILLADEKETAEHNTIVDLIRNDLSMVAEEVVVEKFRYIETLKTHKGDLLQMSSKITGRLPEDYKAHLGDILLKLLPAGSISGAPKPKTVDIIRDAENYERGYYTGIFGYFDGDKLDSAVMIRFIENESGQLYFKSGGGVTAMSDVRREYEELIQKIYVPIA